MHHSERPDSEILRRLQRELRPASETAGHKIGATGDFPGGRLTPTDEGGLRIAITIIDGKVVIDFGTPTAWIGFDANQAIEIGRILQQRGKELQRKV